jgi:hypothetical protein
MPARRRFLISFERGEADWVLFEVPPSGPTRRQMAQQNLDKLTNEKRAALVASLQKELSA